MVKSLITLITCPTDQYKIGNHDIMPVEQNCSFMNVDDMVYSCFPPDKVFENPMLNTYTDYDDIEYLENTDSEGFHYFSDQFPIQSRKQLSYEANANSVVDSIIDNDRIMNSFSCDAFCKPDHLADVEDKDHSLNRTSRISFNNPPVEMPTSSQARDESVVPRAPIIDDILFDGDGLLDSIIDYIYTEGLLNSYSLLLTFNHNVSSTIAHPSMYQKYIDSSYVDEHQDQIACTLTAELGYETDGKLCGNYYLKPKYTPNFISTSLFNAANCNIPCKAALQIQGKHDNHSKPTFINTSLFSAAHCNIPCSILHQSPGKHDKCRKYAESTSLA